MLLVFLIVFGLSFGITLEEGLKILEENNPELRAMRKALESYRGLEISAKAFPNPELRFESGFFSTTQDFKPAGRFIYILEISQKVPLWGLREKRLRVAKTEREVFLYDYTARRYELFSEFYRRFYETLYRKELLKVERENLKLSEEILEFVKNAYRIGERTELELLRARRNYEEARISVSLSENDYERSLKEIRALLGKKVDNVKGNLYTLPEVHVPDIKKSPRVVRYAIIQKLLKGRIELEKALSKPQPSIGILMEDSEEGYYGFRVSLFFEIPLLYRRQGEILRHMKLKEAVLYEMKNEELRLSTSVKNALTRMKTLRESIRLVESVLLPRAEKELSLALKSYRLNVISLLELTDVKRRYFELLRERARLYREFHIAFSELIRIGGVER
ncbi:hypothetical protein JCM9492_08620 [Aquifex pyrophilus]